MTARTGMYSKRFQPTAAQRKVLERFNANRGRMNVYDWAHIPTPTSRAIRQAGWIAPAGEGENFWYGITLLGLAALQQMETMG